MRLKFICCNVLFREFCRYAAQGEHTVDVGFFEKGLHDEPDKLRLELQRLIDASSGKGYDAIVLGAALCGNGCAGLVAGDTPLVLPRAHDCITLLLGSRARYAAQHKANPATYYYSTGWIERAGVGKEKATPTSLEARHAIYLEYVEQYGEENAAYLMDVLHSWQKNYSRACFVDSGLVKGGQLVQYQEQTRHIAESYGWQYEELPGDLRMVQQLVEGTWPAEDFLTVPPGHRIEPSFDVGVVKAVSQG